MTEDKKLSEGPYEGLRRWLFVLLSLICLACAVARALGETHVNPEVLYFLLAAGALLFLERIKKFSFSKDGISWEIVEQLDKKLSNVADKVHEVGEVAAVNQKALIEGIGGKSPMNPESSPAAADIAHENVLQVDPNDPHKGQFGGSPESNGRRLYASVAPAPRAFGLYEVTLEVRSTDSRLPLRGEVIFHLHPSFNMNVRKVTVIEGVARLDLLAYGAFTVGAVADDGRTRLELDLVEDERFPKPFRDR